jgi:hypothetical protein
LELFRRAGLRWFDAYQPAYEAALSVVEPPARLPHRVDERGKAERRLREEERKRLEEERDEWASILFVTRTTWMRAYERRPTGCPL